MLLASGSVTTLIFIIYETWYCKGPFLRLYLLNSSPTAAITFLCTFIHGFILFTLIFYLPLYYQAVKGIETMQSGLAMFSSTVPFLPASVLAGFVVQRTGRYKWIVFGGWVLTLVVSFFMFLDANTVTPVWIVLNIVVGLGLGILLTGTTVAVQATSRAIGQSSSFAVSMLHFFRFFGAVSELDTPFNYAHTNPR